MIKIWEVDFTKFDIATGTRPQDLIGTQHLTSVNGSPTVAAPLPKFTKRPGIYFSNLGNGDGYSYYNAGATNAYFRNAYTGTSRRSFEMWFYYNGGADGLTGWLWMEGDAFGNPNMGFSIDNGNALRFYSNGSFVSSVAGINTDSWHQLVLTVDRVSTQLVFYFDGIQKYSSGTMPATTATSVGVFGANGTSRETNASVGHVATYNHILSSGDVSALFAAGLLDDYVPTPFASRSGTVFDLTEAPISGATVLVYDHLRNLIVSQSLSDGSGTYTARFPYPGEFSVYTTKSGVAGGRASTFTVTASGALIAHDIL